MLESLKTPWWRLPLILMVGGVVLIVLDLLVRLGWIPFLIGLAVVNVARIAMICVATRHWGPGGFELTHRVVGSALIMSAMAASLVVGARLLSSQASR